MRRLPKKKFFRCFCFYLQTDAAALWTTLKRWRLATTLLWLPWLANELLNCRHATSTLLVAHRRLTTSARSSCDPAIRSIVFGSWMPPSRTPRPAERCLSTGPMAGSRGKDPLCPRLEHEGSGGDNSDFPPLPIARTTAPRLVCGFASSACPSEIRRLNAERHTSSTTQCTNICSSESTKSDTHSPARRLRPLG